MLEEWEEKDRLILYDEGLVIRAADANILEMRWGKKEGKEREGRKR
jgi:hypothetical protein